MRVRGLGAGEVVLEASAWLCILTFFNCQQFDLLWAVLTCPVSVSYTVKVVNNSTCFVGWPEDSFKG